MPITLTVSEGVFTPDDEGAVFAELTDALLDVEGLTGNAFLAPNVVGTLNVLPRHRTFVHGRAEPAAFVELKLPAVALAAPERQREFVERATAIVLRWAGGRLTAAQVWVNVVHAVDGGWSIAGRRYDNAALVDSIQRAAAH
ncbi:Tautomerase enzyme [Burkholderia sp. Tr-20390]|uniref:Tautomerase enzyme n=1 Tax=Burkholderia sp. Tr-20390 TaxID=2703904 RepID=UPI001981648B|nr:Tautomerase enzyme [Burkholderia sp. Tr-20390]MBN3729723.1 Tautomerase enzyme [Burkholderia sp. Tr-20390]